MREHNIVASRSNVGALRNFRSDFRRIVDRRNLKLIAFRRAQNARNAGKHRPMKLHSDHDLRNQFRINRKSALGVCADALRAFFRVGVRREFFIKDSRVPLVQRPAHFRRKPNMSVERFANIGRCDFSAVFRSLQSRNRWRFAIGIARTLGAFLGFRSLFKLGFLRIKRVVKTLCALIFAFKLVIIGHGAIMLFALFRRARLVAFGVKLFGVFKIAARRFKDAFAVFAKLRNSFKFHGVDLFWFTFR